MPSGECRDVYSFGFWLLLLWILAVARSLDQNGQAASVALMPAQGSQNEDSAPVLVRIEYAALNYRDFIVASGRFGPVPSGHVAGNEGAGVVMQSSSPAFREGDLVFVNGHGLGEALAGTLSGQVQLPPEAITPLPKGMTTRDAAVVGVAALVAFAAGQPMGEGPIAVTGAMGGTGRVAAACYARAGRDVTALTRDADRAGVLSDLGVSTILPPLTEAELNAQSFGPERFSGAFDVTGGALNWLTRHMRTGGTVALAGFVAGNRPEINALAVILRKLRILGVNAGLSPPDKAQALRWVAETLRPEDYARLAHFADPNEVPALLGGFAGEPGRGRIVVALR
jgi:acrylyl-CoA reductase (NADPH)